MGGWLLTNQKARFSFTLRLVCSHKLPCLKELHEFCAGRNL